MNAEKTDLEILQHDPMKCEKASLGAQTTQVVKRPVAGEASLDRRIIETMGKRPQGYVRCLKMTAPREVFTRRFSERRPRDLSMYSPTPCKGKLTNACVASLSHPNYGFSSPRYSLIPSLENIALKF